MVYIKVLRDKCYCIVIDHMTHQLHFKIDWILENGSKSHIFISLYLSLPHEKYCIPNNISKHYKEFNALITERM